VALRVVEREEKENWCPGVLLSHPVTGGYKYLDMFPQFEGMTRLTTLLCKKIILAKFKEVKTSCRIF
jgi:hypothetical protein